MNNPGHDSEFQSRSLLIRDLADSEKPREKAMRLGFKALTDAELMALLFSTGLKGKSVLVMSEEILHDNDYHLSRLARLSVSEMLARYKGIGPAKAITLLAALELGSRSAVDAARLEYPAITSSEIAYRHMKHHFERLDHEEFWVLLLSNAGRPVRECKIGQGGVTGTVADVKLIMRAVVESLASSIILFHNHPSGTLRPSPQDDALTRKISEAARLLDSKVSDHIIVTDGGYYSYNDEGRL